jgi:hypothetical protein
MSVDLLLYKIAPLCPTLARKLRLVCKRLAKELPTQTREYLIRKEIYTSPLSWRKLFYYQHRFPTMYSRRNQDILCMSDVLVRPFFELVIPHILHENNIQVILSGNLLSLDWSPMMPFTEGPLLLKHTACKLGCLAGTCFDGSPLDWAWTIHIDYVRMNMFITKSFIPRDYVKPIPKESPYNRQFKKCKKCT